MLLQVISLPGCYVAMMKSDDGDMGTFHLFLHILFFMMAVHRTACTNCTVSLGSPFLARPGLVHDIPSFK